MGPAVLAQDTERVGRFRREAQILATLNHPSITATYGLEETAAAGPGQSALVGLVMELVAGEDLAERLRRGAIPVEEAITIARPSSGALATIGSSGRQASCSSSRWSTSCPLALRCRPVDCAIPMSRSRRIKQSPRPG